ncbi:MAG TPA: hypothetical protein V6C81_19405 [Planktothrix sp.]|jgi:hypothetical protein
MQIEIELTLNILAQLVQAKGVMKKAGAPTGRDCFELTTAKGTYMVPTYSAPWAPCDCPFFVPTGETDRNLHLTDAVEDPEVIAFLGEATCNFVVGRNQF